MKISILLPYKENFSPNYAGAVSLFVKDTVKNSKYRKNTFVYGNTDYKKKLLKNYINLDLNKTFYQSGSKLYVESFLEHENRKSSDLIEVHNRPNYIKFLKNETTSKLTLFFNITAAETTGPARHPLPTSSTPAVINLFFKLI